jgi:hypothetical protein
VVKIRRLAGSRNPGEGAGRHDVGMDLRRLRTLTAVACVATLAVALSGCGNSHQTTKAQNDAASACQQLTNLESSIANKAGPGKSQASLTLSNTQRLVNEAAALDGRWKRLQGDVTVIRVDLDNGVGNGFTSAVNDEAGICAPAIENGLGSSVPTTG